MNKLLGWEDCTEITEEDVLDETELNRQSYMAEKPEREDPIFLLLRGQ